MTNNTKSHDPLRSATSNASQTPTHSAAANDASRPKKAAISADAILSRLDRVKQTGAGRYMARCPAHEDRTASLAVRELDDGRLLLKCFAGCSAHEIVGALGLEIGDLFPPREIGHHIQGDRRPFAAADCLRAVAFEALVVCAAAVTVATGEPISPVDRERLVLAVSRIQAALTAGGLNHE